MAENTTNSDVETEEVDAPDEVETSTEEDESTDTDTESETNDDEETDNADTDDSDDDEDDSSEADESDSTFTKRFSQFKGDDLEAYNKNLEEGYYNSSTEALRLNNEVKDLKARLDQITGVVANNPELAEQFNLQQDAPQPVKDPAVRYAETKMQEEMKSEYDEFVRLHPEIESDPGLQERMTKRLAVLAKSIQEDEGRYLGMGEGLQLAWTSLGMAQQDKSEEIRMKAKETAASSKTAKGGTKKVEKSEFTKAQLELAEKLGLTEAQLRENVKNN